MLAVIKLYATESKNYAIRPTKLIQLRNYKYHEKLLVQVI